MDPAVKDNTKHCGCIYSGIYSNVRELLIGHIAKLNNRYRKTHDVAIKAEIDRLTTELAALPERWSFVERKQRQ